MGREIKTEQRLTCELCLFAEVAGVTVLHVGKSRSWEGGGRAVLVPMDGFADVIRSWWISPASRLGDHEESWFPKQGSREQFFGARKSYRNRIKRGGTRRYEAVPAFWKELWKVLGQTCCAPSAREKWRLGTGRFARSLSPSLAFLADLVTAKKF